MSKEFNHVREYSSKGSIRHGQTTETDVSNPRVLTILSYVVEKLVGRNEQLKEYDGDGGKTLNAFHGVRAPNISIAKYLERIYKYTSCSPSCFVVAFIYIDRLLHRYPHSLVLSLNVHRLLLTTLMVASKVLDDAHYNNAFFARVGGVSNTELNKLEMELLSLLDFGVTVSSRVFQSYCFHLEKEMMLNDEKHKIQTQILLLPNSMEDVTEISMEDKSTSSTSHLLDS